MAADLGSGAPYANPLADYQFMPQGGSPPWRVADIAPPENFARIAITGPWPLWVREIPLFPAGTPVKNWRGDAIQPPADAVAVVAADVLGVNCQCADMAIMLRAYYLKKHGRDADIRFKSVSGQWMEWAAWRKGVRYKLSKDGRKLVTGSGAAVGNAYPEHQAFKDYLRFVFTYAGSASLARDLPAIDPADIAPGDLYVQSPADCSIGHVSMVFDVVEGDTGEKMYLVGYGYIPAMNMFIAAPDEGQGAGNWFTRQGFEESVKPFGPGAWRRWD